MTMRYAKFNPSYSDVEAYLNRVAERFGLGASGNSPGNTPKKGVPEPEALNVP